MSTIWVWAHFCRNILHPWFIASMCLMIACTPAPWARTFESMLLVVVNQPVSSTRVYIHARRDASIIKVSNCDHVKELINMTPRPKPSPNRLGPPPQLTSLKVPEIKQRFEKKVNKVGTMWNIKLLSDSLRDCLP